MENNIQQIESSEVVKSINGEVSKILTAAQEIEVCDESTNEYATILSLRISKVLKLIECQRKEWTAPLNQTIKSINAKFASISEPAKTAEQIVNSKLIAYRRKLEEEKRKEAAELQAKLEAEAIKQAGEGQPVAPVPIVAQAPPKTIYTQEGSVSFRKDWDFIIEDEQTIPREYCSPDSSKIRKAIRDGVREIPGVRIFQKETAIRR